MIRSIAATCCGLLVGAAVGFMLGRQQRIGSIDAASRGVAPAAPTVLPVDAPSRPSSRESSRESPSGSDVERSSEPPIQVGDGANEGDAPIVVASGEGAAAMAAAAAGAAPELLDEATRRELSELREELQGAAPEERARLLADLLRRAAAMAVDARAALLNEVFKSDGWFQENAGPAFDEHVWSLATETMAALGPGPARNELAGLVATQMARARGVDALSEVIALVRTNVADERARLEQRASAPSAAAVGAMRDLLGTFADVDADHLDGGAVTSTAFALAGQASTRADREALIALAEKARAPRARACAIAALATTPESDEVDHYLVRFAQDGAHAWGERALAWQALRRRGREDALPIGVRREILEAWAASGANGLDKVFEE